VSTSELKNLYQSIQENAKENTSLVRAEVFRYMADHQDEIVRELQASAEARIPTSVGLVRVSLSDLQAAVS
jgi:hypothetical protein